MRESHTVTVMEGIKWQQRDSYSAIMHPAECKLFFNNQEARSKRDRAVITRAWCCMELDTHTLTLTERSPTSAQINLIYHIDTIYICPQSHTQSCLRYFRLSDTQTAFWQVNTFLLKIENITWNALTKRQ